MRGRVRFMAHPISLQIIPTGTVGFSNMPLSKIPNIREKGPQAKTMMSLVCQTPRVRSSFPPEVKTVNMIYVTHIPKKERKRALRDVYAIGPVAPKFNPWSACPITFDRRDHPTSIRHGGSAALVLDPTIHGYHLTRVLMDRVSSLNLIYQDTICKMGIDPSRIKPSNTTFKGVIPGVEARARAH